MPDLRNITSILGIPIDNLDMDATVQRIFEFVQEPNPDVPSRLVTTVNVDFMVNSLAWFGSMPRHPELVCILREADLSTADGMPLVWGSRLLGGGLAERVAGADLVPRLAAEAAGRGCSLYLLGGDREVAEQAARTLQEHSPSLRIAGVDSPFVHTQGHALADAHESDQPICERINRSGADILLVAFGNPKQEMWFRRNQHCLNVPVAIGIGGTFNFITGATSRAPQWMRRAGLEWIFRLSQEPRRLWKRYCIGLFKYSFIMLPAVALSLWGRWRWSRNGSVLASFSKPWCFLSGQQAIRLITIPTVLNADSRPWLESELDDAMRQNGVVIDFSRWRFADASGLGLLLAAWEQMIAQGIPCYGIGLSCRMRQLLRIHRLWDLLKPRVCRDARELTDRLRERWSDCRSFVAIQTEAHSRVIALLGAFTSREVARLDRTLLAEGFADQHCIVDLSLCTTVDSSGLGFLARLDREVKAKGNDCILCGLSEEVERTLQSAGLSGSLLIVPEITAARDIVC